MAPTNKWFHPDVQSDSLNETTIEMVACRANDAYRALWISFGENLLHHPFKVGIRDALTDTVEITRDTCRSYFAWNWLRVMWIVQYSPKWLIKLAKKVSGSLGKTSSHRFKHFFPAKSHAFIENTCLMVNSQTDRCEQTDFYQISLPW